MVLAQTINDVRFSLVDWLSGFDTRLPEFSAGLINITQMLMVLTEYNGKSVAPFLESAIFRLELLQSQPFWCTVLCMTGLFQLTALGIGTRRNTYLLRFLASLCGTFVSLAIVLALMSGPQPFIVSWRYFIPFGIMFFATCSLWVKHQDAVTDENLLSGQK